MADLILTDLAKAKEKYSMLIFLELLSKFCRPPHLDCRNKKRAPANRKLPKNPFKTLS